MKSINKKCLIISTVLIIIICGLLFCYYARKGNPTIKPINDTITNIKEVDTSTWKNYTNNQLGFSIKIPLEVPTLYRCPDNKQAGNTPLGAFEDNQNGSVYISQEYYYDANWNQPEQKYTGECNKITYSLEFLKKEGSRPFLGWKIIINNPKNDTDITNFIKQNFGATCTIESKDLQVNGNYEIRIKGKDVGQNLIDTNCPTNFEYKILYSSEKNKLMSVILGQECTFGTNPSMQSSYQCYDNEMIDSFKFQ